jgi:hypothetical protein
LEFVKAKADKSQYIKQVDTPKGYFRVAGHPAMHCDFLEIYQDMPVTT